MQCSSLIHLPESRDDPADNELTNPAGLSIEKEPTETNKMLECEARRHSSG